jgi:hypothetical protein
MWCTLSVLLLVSASCLAESVDIQLAHNTPAEQQTEAALKRLLQQYDTSKYTFTHKVIIDEESIPHSHPVLTLHTRHLGHDDEMLSTYVHEQLHWYLDSKQKQTAAAEAELKKMYPKVPVGYPDGAQDEESDYLHLIDCYLEWQADRQLLGDARALAVMQHWAGDHYRWVYKAVLADANKIKAVVQHNNLEIT